MSAWQACDYRRGWNIHIAEIHAADLIHTSFLKLRAMELANWLVESKEQSLNPFLKLRAMEPIYDFQTGRLKAS